MYASRAGSYEKAESYEANDMLKGDLRELDENGNTKEGGIAVEGAIMMPSYIKVEEQKNLFNDAKVGDVITFNPKKAYPDNDTEVSQLLKIEREAVKDLESEFSYQVTEIQRFKKHEINEELQLTNLLLAMSTNVQDKLVVRVVNQLSLQALSNLSTECSLVLHVSILTKSLLEEFLIDLMLLQALLVSQPR